MRGLPRNHHDQFFVSRRKRREGSKRKSSEGKKNRFHKKYRILKRGSTECLITKE
jgi:hypothetical protein